MMDFPMSHWLTDPYKGRADKAAWEEAFRAEYPVSGLDPNGLYGTLRGLRCLGVSLRENRGGGFRFAPPPDMDHDDLEAIAGNLWPAAVKLVGRVSC